MVKQKIPKKLKYVRSKKYSIITDNKTADRPANIPTISICLAGKIPSGIVLGLPEFG